MSDRATQGVAEMLRDLEHIEKYAADFAPCRTYELRKVMRNAAETIRRLSQSSGEPRDELAWVIEQQSGPYLLYFAPGFSKLDGDMLDWSSNNLEAVRFSRRIDAEKTLLLLRATRPGHDRAVVSEHMWCAMPSPETKEVKP